MTELTLYLYDFLVRSRGAFDLYTSNHLFEFVNKHMLHVYFGKHKFYTMMKKTIFRNNLIFNDIVIMEMK